MGKKQGSRGLTQIVGSALWIVWVFCAYVLYDSLNKLRKVNVQATLATPQNKVPKGYKELARDETDTYTRLHIIEDGIERITYTPKNRKFETPIFMQHGMWHGAWCWQDWQELFANWGWESIAISLPGHAGSPLQKPMTEITLDYYLAFLRDEMNKLDKKPVLMGHSMGGALSQWYLRYISDDLPAVVLVGSWVHDAAMRDGAMRFFRLDPIGVMMTFWTRTAAQYVRTPEHAAQKLISPNALYTPEELHAQLGSESALVMMQHNPPFWYPPINISTPMIYVAGEKDTVIGVEAAQKTATYYDADFIVVPDSGHNIMMDAHHDITASHVHDWLIQKGVQ